MIHSQRPRHASCYWLQPCLCFAPFAPPPRSPFCTIGASAKVIRTQWREMRRAVTQDYIGGSSACLPGKLRLFERREFCRGGSSGSLLSAHFTNNAYASNSIVSTLTNNFGIEAWVKPESSADGILLYNGKTGNSGWGFTIATNLGLQRYGVLYGGVDVFGAYTATNDVWAHLALVCSNGISTFYVNGLLAATRPVIPNVTDRQFRARLRAANAGSSSLHRPRSMKCASLLSVPINFSASDLLLNAPIEKVDTLARHPNHGEQRSLEKRRDSRWCVYGGLVRMGSQRWLRKFQRARLARQRTRRWWPSAIKSPVCSRATPIISVRWPRIPQAFSEAGIKRSLRLSSVPATPSPFMRTSHSPAFPAPLDGNTASIYPRTTAQTEWCCKPTEPSRFGATTPPARRTSPRASATSSGSPPGNYHFLALKRDGTVGRVGHKQCRANQRAGWTR